MRDNTVSIRQPCPPFCWQNKIVLEHIRRHTAESILPNSLLLYFVLTELASDKQAAGDFRVKHSTVVKKCGLSRRTVISRLQGLEQIGVISVFPNFGPDGRQLPSSIRLHGPGELPRNAGEGATIALGEGAIAPPPRCTPYLINNKEEEESPLTPQRGEASPSAAFGLEQIRAFAVEIGATVESAERFHRMNEAGGWRDRAGNPIRNWKRAFLAFIKRDAAEAAAKTAGHPAPDKPRRPRRKAFYSADHSKGF